MRSNFQIGFLAITTTCQNADPSAVINADTTQDLLAAMVNQTRIAELYSVNR